MEGVTYSRNRWKGLIVLGNSMTSDAANTHKVYSAFIKHLGGRRDSVSDKNI